MQNLPFGFPLMPFVSGGYFPPPIIDDRDLFISSSVGPPGPAGPPGPPGSSVGVVPTTIVTTSSFAATLSDYFIAVNVEDPTVITLPVSPTGTVFIIKDINGCTDKNPISISAIDGCLIDGFATALINRKYRSLHLIFNGSEWNII